MLTNSHNSCIYFFLIELIVYEIRQVATLPAWPHYPSFPYRSLKATNDLLFSKYVRNKYKRSISVRQVTQNKNYAF